ncbi:hypothetical protein CVT25_010542 [Psilocybe cyanescens]|uniref:Cytochrome P450 n=1 Tax=Psilocybe cyanescens TaxID=93625 RepID=A0A409WJG5_PSICY|nr:hypothetical protein CVT25_010542 [Psilocybe cyanescens]
MFDHNNFSTGIISVPIVVGILALAVTSVFKWLGKAGYKYPPGPKGIPFFGNFFQLSRKGFQEWGHKYAAVDLFDRRSGIYSDRPNWVVLNSLTHGLLLGAVNYGELWRKMRRGGHQFLNKTATTQYYQLQELEALILSEHLLKDSTNWQQEVFRSSISMLRSTVYDVPPTVSVHDPVIESFNKFDSLVMEATVPGNYLVEFFGYMKFLPSVLAPWKAKMTKGFKEASVFFERLCEDVEKQINEGDEKLSIAGFAIREQERLGLSKSEVAWLPATLANGSASLAEALLWFFLAMVAFPEEQKRCQEEIDSVVGRSRMPSFEDSESLPYLRATVREVLRWRPISPLGTQHVTRQGDDAEEFRPARFLDKEGKFVPIAGDTKDAYLESEGHVAYGFGPRLLWTATVSPVMDKQTGNPILPDLKNTDGAGITVRPPAFEMEVNHRFSEAAALFSQTKELLG